MASALAKLLLISTAVGLVACAPLPKPGEAESRASVRAAAEAKFAEDLPVPAVQHVLVPGSSMRAELIHAELPAELSNKRVDLVFPQSDSKLSDLMHTLSAEGIPVTFNFSSGNRKEFLDRSLPFVRFRGTMREMLGILRNGMGIVSSYENGTVYLTELERYAISLPQNDELLKSISDEIKLLGATDIVTSLRGGKILYSAPPKVQDNTIRPFMSRMVRNLSVVSLQVAVVSLNMTDNASQGFDWKKFGAAIDQRQSSVDQVRNRTTSTTYRTNGNIANPQTTITSETGPIPTQSGASVGAATSGTAAQSGAAATGTGVGTGSASSTASSLLQAGLNNAVSAGSIALGGAGVNKLFGVDTAMSVTGAIAILSEFGNTRIAQNVELKTLSGAPVELKSTETIPYVKSIGQNVSGTGQNLNSTSAVGGSSSLGTAQTETVDVGLELTLKPNYDADAQIVTIDLDLKLSSLLEFVKLSAGNQLGELSQPRTQEQSLNDIIRIQAGRTIVVGGLQYDEVLNSNNEPTVLRDTVTANGGRGLGLRERKIKRSALFVIVKPTVTTFTPDQAVAAATKAQIQTAVRKAKAQTK